MFVTFLVAGQNGCVCVLMCMPGDGVEIRGPVTSLHTSKIFHENNGGCLQAEVAQQ